MRLTCTGELYMCLGQEDMADLRAPLRASPDDARLEEAIRAAIAAARSPMRRARSWPICTSYGDSSCASRRWAKKGRSWACAISATEGARQQQLKVRDLGT